MSVFIEAAHSGKVAKLALWELGTNYNAPHLSGAWGLIVKSRQAVEGLWSMASTIEADDRRSDSAKADDIRAQRLQRASEIGKLQRQLIGLRANHEAAKRKLSAVAPYTAEDGAAMAILDVEIARQVTAMEPSKRAALVQFGHDQRTVDALLRVPPIISGLTPEQVSSLTEIAVARRHPDQARELAEQGLALDRAESAVRRAFEVTADGLSLDERVSAAGGDAGLIRHVRPETVERIHDRLQAEDEAQADDADA
ncbi:MAG: hypothetical protein E6Q69_08920 [Aquipseudomonas alcaligenes]|uniref:Uncharacterized protein n=1 Tax=Aquipseudomonas alcaligenes TaxID=43263 RepID=A0A5C7W706_AQUAC|nr:MAG: hypothetical protein E6Q69_08920 [Pseudomonas alcaligenes]